MTQRLLVQCEEVNRHSETTWPRFHDLLRIYQIQNIALAGSRTASSNNEEAQAHLNMPRLPPQLPRSSLAILDSMMQSSKSSEHSEPRVSELRDKNVIIAPSFQPLTAALLTDSTSFTAPPSKLPPIITSEERETYSLPWIKTVPYISHPQVSHTLTLENRTPQLHLPRLRHSELGKRLYSSYDTGSVMRPSLPMVDAQVDGCRRARIY